MQANGTLVCPWFLVPQLTEAKVDTILKKWLLLLTVKHQLTVEGSESSPNNQRNLLDNSNIS